MEYHQLDELLMAEFCDKVEALKPEQLKSAASIRTLADISSVLLCLWHPTVRAHFEAITAHHAHVEQHADGSYLQEAAKHNPY